MNTYMESLRKKVGYVSMKIRYAEHQAIMFPSLIGIPGEVSSDQELGHLWSMEEEGIRDPLNLLNPNEEREAVISEQKQRINDLMKEKQDKATMEDEYKKIAEENKRLAEINKS